MHQTVALAAASAPSRPRFRLNSLALAVALVGLAPGARAEVLAGGFFGTRPANLVIGPGDTDLGANTLFIGSGAPGSFAVTAGSQVAAAAISLQTVAMARPPDSSMAH